MRHFLSLLTCYFCLILSAYTQGKCDIVFQGIDLSTKAYRIEIAPEHFFNHTPKEIKQELRSDNLISATGQLVQNDEVIALHMNMDISSLIAPQEYGAIDRGAELRVILLNGKEVKLTCYAGSPGVKKNDNTGYLYPVGYTVEGKHTKQLLKSEIDKIGIQWSSGYEEYTIYEVDFFINQIECLQAAKPN